MRLNVGILPKCCPLGVKNVLGTWLIVCVVLPSRFGKQDEGGGSNRIKEIKALPLSFQQDAWHQGGDDASPLRMRLWALFLVPLAIALSMLMAVGIHWDSKLIEAVSHPSP